MTTHELLGKECLPFTDVFLKIAYKGLPTESEKLLDELDQAHRFLVQPLTPEWVEKYLEGFDWVDTETFNGWKSRVLTNGKIDYWDINGQWWCDSELIEPKHPSHLFESLPDEIKLTYKNVDI